MAKSINCKGMETPEEIPKLKSELLNSLAISEEVELNLTGIEQIHSAFIQLLISAKQSYEKKGVIFRTSHASPELLSLIQLLNIEREVCL